jgi:hypothetical protein
MLKEINAKDLLFTNNIEDDRTNTYLTLNDYDWMTYQLDTKFRTDEQGTLMVTFEYQGMTTATMVVTQTKNGEEKFYKYEYPTSLFEKHIKNFLIAHLASWDEVYAFNGEDFVVDFYNEVLKVGTLK